MPSLQPASGTGPPLLSGWRWRAELGGILEKTAVGKEYFSKIPEARIEMSPSQLSYLPPAHSNDAGGLHDANKI